jgi:hypothetical protein
MAKVNTSISKTKEEGEERKNSCSMWPWRKGEHIYHQEQGWKEGRAKISLIKTKEEKEKPSISKNMRKEGVKGELLPKHVTELIRHQGKERKERSFLIKTKDERKRRTFLNWELLSEQGQEK